VGPNEVEHNVKESSSPVRSIFINPMPENSEPLNYPVTNPDGSVSPRYPVATERRESILAASAHAYIDYLEGCLTEIRLRLEPLEQAHADLNAAFHRRSAEFESRLDNAQAEITDLKNLAIHQAGRIAGLEKYLGPKPP
jgi:hypothetical protein